MRLKLSRTACGSGVTLTSGHDVTAARWRAHGRHLKRFPQDQLLTANAGRSESLHRPPAAFSIVLKADSDHLSWQYYSSTLQPKMFGNLKIAGVLAGLLLSAIPSAAAQVPLGGSETRVNYPFGHAVDPKSVATEGVLSTLSDDEFTTFVHPSKPSYGLRIKKSPKDFCDPTVKSYSGYLDVDYGTKHMFFYFFESRSNPDKDDVLMWINGGPGCSSSMGLFMELGPCSVQDPLASGLNATKWNPHSWNSNTNLFFLDQP